MNWWSKRNSLFKLIPNTIKKWINWDYLFLILNTGSLVFTTLVYSVNIIANRFVNFWFCIATKASFAIPSFSYSPYYIKLIQLHLFLPNRHTNVTSINSTSSPRLPFINLIYTRKESKRKINGKIIILQNKTVIMFSLALEFKKHSIEFNTIRLV